MSRNEILSEIKRLRTEIALETFGSIKIEDLTTELILVYSQYVELIEGVNKG